ncbi:MAG: alkaline phosphatase family protein [Acidobacteriota bacterium]|nr:alkaline phosphatase family protein [Acidobacteriota bacterium]OQB57849.1 MAG: Type I phosphodiesterase / nucleotide pyrophosphatase [Candidatus Aminicenantes bacterium ADurb.Bin147]
MFKRLNPLVCLVVSGLLIFGLSASCRKKGVDSGSPRVILIGVDGASWNFMNPLIKRGKLPNFERLMKEGSSGVLRTINPTKSSVIWTSIATGKTMVKHGIVDWTYIKDNDITVPYSQSARRVKAFWNILGELGLNVGVVNWFVTFPPEEVNGYMVSPAFATGADDPLAPGAAITYPPELLGELDFVHGENYESLRTKESIPDLGAGAPKGSLAAHFYKYLLADRAVESASLYLYKKHPVNVFATYFRILDVTSHFAVSHVDPELLAKANEESKKDGVSKATRGQVDLAFSRVLEPVYAYMDRVVGRILGLADDRTTVIVVSDHGFMLGKDGMGYNHFKMPTLPHGVVFLKGPAFKAGYKIEKAHIYDILPTLLYLLGQPAAEDMDGKIMTEAFKDEFLKTHSVKTVKTYEGGAARKIAPDNKEIEKKMLEDLRTLGYIK